MKFEKYLIEAYPSQDEINDAAMKIKKDCGMAIDLLKRKRIIFKRYYERFNPKKHIDVFKARKDRQPKDTSEKYHKIINKALHDMFGWYPRSEGVFCWALRVKDLERYSGPGQGIVFPIGNFKIVFAKKEEFKDLFNTIVERYAAIYGDRRREELWDKPKEEQDKFINDLINDMKKAYSSDASKLTGTNKTGEVSISCDQYYMISYELADMTLGRLIMS